MATADRLSRSIQRDARPLDRTDQVTGTPRHLNRTVARRMLSPACIARAALASDDLHPRRDPAECRLST
jgi:hypothetical protein